MACNFVDDRFYNACIDGLRDEAYEQEQLQRIYPSAQVVPMPAGCAVCLNDVLTKEQCELLNTLIGAGLEKKSPRDVVVHIQQLYRQTIIPVYIDKQEPVHTMS